VYPPTCDNIYGFLLPYLALNLLSVVLKETLSECSKADENKGVT
jgi:hypothetical protein